MAHLSTRGERFVASKDFIFEVGGPAVADGRIPVRELAPSLMALGELLEVARQVAEPDTPPMTLEIRGFGKGSFDAFLGISFDDAINTMLSDPVVAAANVLTLVSHGKSGVLAMFRALGGRRVAGQESTDEPDLFIVRNNEGQTIVAPQSTINIYNDPRTPLLGSSVLRPLREPGVEVIRMTNPAEETLEVTKEELASIPDGEDASDLLQSVELGRSERETILAIHQAPLQDPGRLKWKFSEGQSVEIWAKITHRKFINDLENHREHLDIGDRIRCRILQIQKDHPEKGLQVDFEVVEVIEHLGPPPLPVQPSLPQQIPEVPGEDSR